MLVTLYIIINSRGTFSFQFHFSLYETHTSVTVLFNPQSIKRTVMKRILDLIFSNFPLKIKFRKKKENYLNIHFMIYHRNLVLFPYHILKIILRFDDVFKIYKRRIKYKSPVKVSSFSRQFLCCLCLTVILNTLSRSIWNLQWLSLDQKIISIKYLKVGKGRKYGDGLLCFDKFKN